MTNYIRSLLTVSSLALTSSALADLPVITISVASLPYSLSPNSYDNSPSKYSNSIANYGNSASNYRNSPSNYANSASNYKNSRNGSNRLIMNGGFIGYYVDNGDGVINFFSSSGKRALYNPKDTSAVFTNDGRYAGVLATSSSDKLTLALTSEGIKYLLLK